MLFVAIGALVNGMTIGYLGYLMEKRFPFSWAFEGTRSRVGKLMPPRYGLIKYIIEAAHATEASDLHFIPVSVSYDLIGEAGDYAREQSGQKKRPESLTWFLGYVRRLKAPMGRIYFDFCEPVVIEGKTPPPDEVDIAKTAFEVAVRVNSVTPVTFPSLACMTLLGVAPRALTFREFRSQLIGLIVWLRKRNIRMTDNFDAGKVKKLEELRWYQSITIAIPWILHVIILVIIFGIPECVNFAVDGCIYSYA